MQRLYRFALLAALIPSAWLAWTWREMPQAGIYHDDAINLVTARSLAMGQGYRIDSLPERPYQTKYPPLYPLMLSLVWKFHSNIEQALPRAALLCWLMLAGAVFLTWTLLRQCGFDERGAAIVCVFLSLNPACVMSGLLTMSELPMINLLLAAMLCAERGKPAWAGLIGGLAFLMRTSALPLLISLPVAFLWRGRRRDGAITFASMIPFVAGWAGWTATHRYPSRDVTALFYIDYVGLYLQDTSLAALPSLVWANLASLIQAVGEFVLLDEGASFAMSMLARLLLVGSVVGVIRLVRQGRMVAYAAFAVFYLPMVLLWNYPPNTRFLLPVLPLMAAALFTEASKLAGAVRLSFRKPKPGDRIAAVVVLILLTLLVGYSLERSVFGLTRGIPRTFAARARDWNQQRPALEWLARHVDPRAAVLSYSDPMVYLRTGRRGWSVRLPPSILKRGDQREIRKYFQALPDFVRVHGLGFVYLTAQDYHFDVPSLTLPAYREAIASCGMMEPLVRWPNMSIYRVRLQ
jgi:hypothetical protein